MDEKNEFTDHITILSIAKVPGKRYHRIHLKN